MRTNKFIPFYLALTLHMIPLIYIFNKTSTIPKSPNASSKGVEISNFSFLTSSGQINPPPFKTPTKTVGLRSPSIPGPGATSEISNDSKAGFEGQQEAAKITFYYFKNPDYPMTARQRGYEGKVKIKVYYNQFGLVTQVDLLNSSGIKMLDEIVLKTAHSWKITNTAAGDFEKVFEFKLSN